MINAPIEKMYLKRVPRGPLGPACAHNSTCGFDMVVIQSRTIVARIQAGVAPHGAICVLLIFTDSTLNGGNGDGVVCFENSSFSKVISAVCRESPNRFAFEIAPKLLF